MDDPTRLLDELIDQALEERPLAPLPPGFTSRVMAQIRTSPLQTARAAVRFKLELVDIAVPLLIACLVVLVLGLSGQLAFLGIAAPVDWAALLPQPLERIPFNWLSLLGLLFVEFYLGALFCMWLWLERPLPLANGEG